MVRISTKRSQRMRAWRTEAGSSGGSIAPPAAATSHSPCSLPSTTTRPSRSCTRRRCPTRACTRRRLRTSSSRATGRRPHRLSSSRWWMHLSISATADTCPSSNSTVAKVCPSGWLSSNNCSIGHFIFTFCPSWPRWLFYMSTDSDSVFLNWSFLAKRSNIWCWPEKSSCKRQFTPNKFNTNFSYNILNITDLKVNMACNSCAFWPFSDWRVYSRLENCQLCVLNSVPEVWSSFLTLRTLFCVKNPKGYFHRRSLQDNHLLQVWVLFVGLYLEHLKTDWV